LTEVGIVSRDEAVTPIRVIFICTHNSARSIMAEALLREKGGARFDVHSAGTEADEVRPLTLRVLTEAGLPTDGLHSKSADDFLERHFDYVITVCHSARQRCPTFAGEGRRLHWDHDDPSAAEGAEDERLKVFRRVFGAIGGDVDRFITSSGTTST
jgi:arsenate reductase